MKLQSSAFAHGETIPRKYTCDGADLSPPLEWNDVPEGTQSFVLIMDDPDAPVGTFTHWIAFNIPGSIHSFPEGAAQASPNFRQGRNDFRRVGYGGPCPPRGHGRHRYFFRLYALNIPALNLQDGASRRDVENAMQGHVLASAEYMGTYERT